MSQIKKKFIADKAIDGSKILLQNDEALKALNSLGVERSIMKFNSSNALEFMEMPEITADPTSGNQVSRKSYVDTEVSSEETRAMGEEARIEGKVDQEISDRQSAVSAEQSRAESAEAALDARLDTLEGADNVAGSVAKALKDAKDYSDQKISDLVNGAPGVLDTLKELSDALGGDENFAATLAGQMAGLDGRLDTLEGDETTAGSVAKALKDAKDYTDAEVSAEETRAMGEESRIEGKVDQEILDRQLAMSEEQMYRAAADNDLSARLDVIEGADTVEGSVAKAEKDAKDYTDAQIAIEQDVRDAEITAVEDRLDILEGADTLEGSVAKAEKDAKDYADSIMATEQSARQASDEDLQDQIDTEKGRIDAILLASDADKDSFAEIVQLINSVDTTNDSAFASYVLSNDAALAQEVSDRQAAVSAEQSARESADSALDARLDILEADPVTFSYVASAIAAEQSTRENADVSFNTRLNILEADPVTQMAVNVAIAAEQSAREAADSALSSRVDALEAVAHYKESFTMGASVPEYVELSMEAMENSTIVFVGRLGAVEGEDYSVSVVDGKTRITFTGELASGGASALSEGDKVHVKFMK